MAASAAITVMPKAMAPTVRGMLVEPGGATVADQGVQVCAVEVRPYGSGLLGAGEEFSECLVEGGAGVR